MPNQYAIERFEADDGCAILTLEDTLLMHFRSVATPRTLEAALRANEAIRRRYDGVCLLLFAEPECVLPSAEVREAGAEMTRKVAPFLRCQATVLLGEGFWAAALRGFLTTTSALTLHGYPRRVFSGAGEAIRWQQTYRQSAIPGGTILHEIETLRGSIANAAQ